MSEAPTPRASGFLGVNAIDPVGGGGTDGIADVYMNIPLERRFGGTDASNAAGARNMIFDYGALNLNGDIYYRSSATQLARLPIGNPGQVLEVNPARLPRWGDGGGPGTGNGTGGGIEEAPTNGRYHVRTNAEWSEDIDDGVY